MLSNILIFINLLFFIQLYKYYEKLNKNDFENTIAILLLSNVISSILVLSSVNSNSVNLRKIYETLTKTLLFLIPIYILFYKKDVDYCTKEKVIVLLILSSILYNIYSKEKNYNSLNLVIPNILFYICVTLSSGIALS